jgi:hypothetical protein
MKALLSHGWLLFYELQVDDLLGPGGDQKDNTHSIQEIIFHLQKTVPPILSLKASEYRKRISSWFLPRGDRADIFPEGYW